MAAISTSPALPKAVPKPAPPPPPPATGPAEPAKDATVDPVPNHKSTLCQFLGKALHKSLEKNDVQFTVARIGNDGPSMGP